MSTIDSNFINLHFSDYLLFAILLTILYGITAFEFYSGINQKILSDEKKVDLKKGATWTFFGILLTIIGGLIAELNLNFWTECSPLIIPFSFLFIWAGFHKRASNLIDMELFEANINEYYKKRIIEIFNSQPLNCISLEKIYLELGFSSNFIPEIFELAFKKQNRFSFSVTKDNMRDLFNPIFPTKEKIEKVLKEMVGDLIEYNESDKCYKLKKVI